MVKSSVAHCRQIRHTNFRLFFELIDDVGVLLASEALATVCTYRLYKHFQYRLIPEDSELLLFREPIFQKPAQGHRSSFVIDRAKSK